MRKIILNVAMSLDGLIEGPGGEFDWCLTDQDYGMTDFLSRIDAVFYGRKSYEVLMSMGDSVNPFAHKKNYVFSRTWKGEGAERVNSIARVPEIKKEAGKDIWLFGGAELTKCMIEAELVDELLLAVHPLVLGKGKPMFNLDGRLHLELLHTHKYSTGLVGMHYRVLYDTKRN